MRRVGLIPDKGGTLQAGDEVQEKTNVQSGAAWDIPPTERLHPLGWLLQTKQRNSTIEGRGAGF